MAPLGYIALLLLWVLFFWLYRNYRLDKFRQKLFALRDELFDYAHEGHVSFDDPAYGMLRSTINGTIQFGHQLGFLELLTTYLFATRGKSAKARGNQFDRKWDFVCQKLPHETQEKLRDYRNRMHYLVFEQIVLTSFILMATMLTIGVSIIFLLLKNVCTKQMEKMLSGTSFRRLFSDHDYSANLYASR